jgi:hypothetical protein
MLPPRRRREILPKEFRREWPRHRKFVRSHRCVVPGCRQEPVVFAHIRSAANSGTALKPHDGFGLSLCVPHHAEQHRIGQGRFEVRHGIDLLQLADEFRRKSPDADMKESWRGQDDENRNR